MQEENQRTRSKTCGSKYGLETKCTYNAKTGDRTWAQWCCTRQTSIFLTVIVMFLPTIHNITIMHTCQHLHYPRFLRFSDFTVTKKTTTTTKNGALRFLPTSEIDKIKLINSFKKLKKKYTLNNQPSCLLNVMLYVQ